MLLVNEWCPTYFLCRLKLVYREGKERPSHHSYRSGQDCIRTINLLLVYLELNIENISRSESICWYYMYRTYMMSFICNSFQMKYGTSIQLVLIINKLVWFTLPWHREMHLKCSLYVLCLHVISSDDIDILCTYMYHYNIKVSSLPQIMHTMEHSSWGGAHWCWEDSQVTEQGGPMGGLGFGLTPTYDWLLYRRLRGN